MKYDEFMGKVQAKCRVGTTGEAVKATRATMETLAERLCGEEKNHLASQLPEEVAHYLHEIDRHEKFDVDEFFWRVSEREALDLPVSVHHARAVMDVIHEAVTPGQWDNLMEVLPEDYRPVLESGSEGDLQQPS